MRIYLILFTIVFFVGGCDTLLNGNSPREDRIEAEFELRDAQDRPAQVFSLGAEMKLVYTVENRTGEVQTWTTPDARPFVTFEVVGDKGTVWNSKQGYAFAQVIIQKELAADGNMQRVLALTLSDTLFSPGTYQARAIPEFTFERAAEPPVLTKTFEVTP